MPREVNMPEQQDNQDQVQRIMPPLAEIRLENFKSVNSATVTLRQLSVVVGRNSSGKSTLLQSVLALAQAVRNKSNSSQFPLNGEYVRLGTFGEVLSFQNTIDRPEIAIGFSVAADSRSPRFRNSRGTRDPSQRNLISWTGHLKAPEEPSNGFATLTAFEFGISTTSDQIESSRVSLDVSAVRSEIDRQGPWPVAVDPRSFRPDRSLLWVDGRIVDLTSGKSSRVDSVSVTGGLPSAAFRQETRFVVYARQWWDAYNEVLSEAIALKKTEHAEKISQGNTVKKKNDAIEVAYQNFLEIFEFENNSGRLVDEDEPSLPFGFGPNRPQRFFERRSIRLNEKKRDAVAESIAALGEAEFNSRLKVSLSKEEWIKDLVQDDIGSEIGGDLWAATRSAEILFRDLQYLGPLRESPQVLYNPGPSRIDLGTKGEDTAAVLHAHQNRKYMVPLPDGSVRNTRLGEALNLWLVELGLADEAKATDRGRLGIGLTVSPVGSGKDVDLTSVGVGVSQVLPVLLLCLLARRGSVVLMEQPELHLHPAMQLRLADFLLACAKSGRQIIIETHSEHLVNRLRLHVAQDETSATSDHVQLLFAEQENGVTSYRTSQINPLGGLSEDWPRGFLDVGSDEAGQLLRQTVLRQRQISSKKD
jgi:energy-coupling factor transporter ATP-binding protein EcfA2